MQRVKTAVDFTEGKVLGKILLFVLPIVVTNLLQVLYNATDMMVVSLSSEKNAVASVGVTGSVINLFVNLFIGLSVGANVVVSQAIGAREQGKIQKAVHTAVILALGAGLLGMVVGIVFCPIILRAMDVEGSLLTLATRYTTLYFIGIPFMSLTNYLIAIFRAKGDSKTPLVVLSLSGFLNVGLNLFFVLVCDFSVEGVVSQTYRLPSEEE